MAADPATGYRAALTSPVARRLWGASAASTIGDYIGLGALLFLAVDRTGLAIGAAAVFAVGVVPSMLTGLVGGSWLDRFPRARTLAMLQIVGGCGICLPVFIDGAAVVFLAAAIISVVRIATIAVRSGAMADGIRDEQRGPLVALISSTDQGAQVVGYLTGGALYVALGSEVALLIDAASFLIGALVLERLRLPETTRQPDRPGATAGLRDIAADPVLRLLAVLVILTGTVASLPEVLAPTVAGPDDPWRPFVLAAAPAGQVVTMALLGRLPHIRRPSVQLAHLTGLAIALGIAAASRSPAAIGAANLLVGAGVAWIVGPQLTFLRLAPKARMAQITGTMVALLVLAEGVGSLAFAAVADTAGVNAAYGAACVLLMLAAAGGWLVKRRTPAVQALDHEESPAQVPVA